MQFVLYDGKANGIMTASLDLEFLSDECNTFLLKNFPDKTGGDILIR